MHSVKHTVILRIPSVPFHQHFVIKKKATQNVAFFTGRKIEMTVVWSYKQELVMDACVMFICRLLVFPS